MCVLVLAVGSPVRADNYILEVTIWKVELREGQLAPTSYKEVLKLAEQKAAKIAYSSAIAAQKNKPFKLSAIQDGTDQILRLSVEGDLGRPDEEKKDSEPDKKEKNEDLKKKDTDKKEREPQKKGADKDNGEVGTKDADKKVSFSVNIIFKTEEKITKGKSLSIEVNATGDLHQEGQVLSVLQTPQGTFLMTLFANKK
jgi:hypothetical protein